MRPCSWPRSWRFALVVLVIAVVIARTFLQPFDDLAGSQAQLEVLYREAREDSLHDGLTGLGNHRSFQEELDRQLEIHRRHKVPVSLLLLDLDDLKVVNDGEGHPAGDRLLVGMANSIRDALRYGDRGFRIGGDEFAVILPHTEAPDALVRREPAAPLLPPARGRRAGHPVLGRHLVGAAAGGRPRRALPPGGRRSLPLQAQAAAARWRSTTPTATRHPTPPPTRVPSRPSATSSGRAR